MSTVLDTVRTTQSNTQVLDKEVTVSMYLAVFSCLHIISFSSNEDGTVNTPILERRPLGCRGVK